MDSISSSALILRTSNGISGMVDNFQRKLKEVDAGTYEKICKNWESSERKETSRREHWQEIQWMWCIQSLRLELTVRFLSFAPLVDIKMDEKGIHEYKISLDRLRRKKADLEKRIEQNKAFVVSPITS